MWFELEDKFLNGGRLLRGARLQDTRGEFSRIFCEQSLSELLGVGSFPQMNRSLTLAPGCIRGLHYQCPPHGELKVIRCTRGEVWDVAVDLRRDSPTWLQWHAEKLSAENQHIMVLPKGFAHGFQVLQGPAELFYLHSHNYTPDAEAGLRFDDPRLAIEWPLSPVDVSERDLQFASITDDFSGIES